MQELDKLCQMFSELCSVSDRLRPLISEEEATQLESEVNENGEKVGELKKTAEKRLETKVTASAEEVPPHNQRSLIHSDQSKDEVTTDESTIQSGGKPSMSLTIELMRKHSSLQGQMGLFDDLLESRDNELIEREAEKLQSLYQEVCKIADGLCDGHSEEERNKIMSITGAAQVRVAEILKLVRETTQAN